MRTYFKAYLDWEKAFSALTSEEIGNIFLALFRYARTGEVTEFKGNERILLPLLINSLDNDQTVYDKVVDRNRQNGEKGGRPKKEETQKTQWVIEEPKKPKESQEKRREEKKREEKKGEEKKRDNIYPDFVGDEFVEAFTSFIQMRKQMKKPLTERGKQIKINKLLKMAEPYRDKERYMIECLDRAIESNWMDVYPLDEFKDALPYDEDQFVKDFTDYVNAERAAGHDWETRMDMDQYFKEWIKTHERSGNGGSGVHTS